MTGSVGGTFAIEAMRRSPLFARADDETLAQCAAGLRIRRFRKGETIFHQGDPGDSLYIMELGAVKVVLPSPEGEEAAIIATLGPGDFFGELALLDGAPHSATVVAIEPTEVLVLRRDVFEGLIDTDRGLRIALLAGLAGELRRLTGHVEELHFLDLPGRLASRLVRLAREQEPDTVGVAVHAVRPCGDDRRHAPDGEPAARGFRRSGPDPPGKGHHRHPGSRPPRSRIRAVSGAAR
jgi:CRP/FNR family cyclic AMP-dependent transcriptional regulator